MAWRVFETSHSPALSEVHSARFALVAWNKDGYLGGGGQVDRLDVETGELVTLARVWDVWGVTTCPAGRIFCTTCGQLPRAPGAAIDEGRESA